MVICEECGAVMKEDELVSQKSWLSDYRGGTYEEYDTCPCGGDVKEAVECKACGEYFDKEEMHGGYCEGCLKELMTVENAIECGKEIDAREEVSVNGFLSAFFSIEEIEELMLKELERRMSKSDANKIRVINRAEEFCKEDESWFVDWLERKEKEKR